MVSTGPDREQTMYVGDFLDHLPQQAVINGAVASKRK
jgi:hypothetical protein